MKPSTVKFLLSVGSLFTGWAFLNLSKSTKLESRSHPACSYDEAIKRIRKIKHQQEKKLINYHNRTTLFSWGKSVEWSIVFFHGYTNCSRQFSELGKQFHDQGCNVFIPCMPYHGFPDTLTKDHAKLTAAQLTQYADDMIDIARGLGKKVVVIGLSAGGTLSGWIALSRKDVYRCILIAPVFGYYGIPKALTKPLMYFFRIMPNFFIWSNRGKKSKVKNSHYIYPRYSSKVLGELLKIGFAIKHILQTTQVSSLPVTLITNSNDVVVSNELIYRVLYLWRKKNPWGVNFYEFSHTYNLDHDLIDPEHENQKIDVVYPIIFNYVPLAK